SEALLEQSARPATPLVDLLARRGASAAALEALKAELDLSEEEDLEERPTKDDPRIGKSFLAVRCDVRIEQSRFFTSYIGRLPHDPEPAGLLLLSTDAIRHGLWVDFLETVRAAKAVTSPGLVPVLDAG